ncbi:hypothetical protein M758_3G177000 [Ceratodon purpureus]|nr:hypothetical protein M758_3G177000 [Ceratodon purpureus]
MTAAGVMPSQGLRLERNPTKVLGSSFLSPSSTRSLSMAAGKSRVPAVSLQQQGSGRSNPLIIRNVVSTEKRDGFASISEEDYAENFRPPHITDNFDIPARPSTFCAKTSLPDGRTINRFSNDLGKIFVHEDDRVLLKTIKYASPASAGAECVDRDCNFHHQWVARAGPRSKIYFDPAEVNAAIVTCGGLCPGLNDVIRQVVLTLDCYGVTNIRGISNGYRGFFEEDLHDIPLNRKIVQNIHLEGGSVLGVSRGGARTTDIVDSIEKKNINMLFVLGGNGTHAGALAIHNECHERGMKVVVVGVPKTIDNDILLMDRTFGFDTAVEEAQKAINSAYIEATSAYNGVGIVKLMGRQSGFIAMHASLASGQVDVCLIPEVGFTLDGPEGLMQHIHYLLETKGRAVICVAEGAGQDLMASLSNGATDASGNPVLGDIGVHLTKEVKKHFKDIGMPADVKYIDPTYMIRACRANASDRILCAVLGQNAVHAGFAGFTGITVGLANNHYVLLPIPEVISHARNVDPNSRMWHRCLTSTGQPDFL